jgi:hypothetical protein
MNSEPKEPMPSEPTHHPHKFSRVPIEEEFTEPETILDSSSIFEQDDRGEGMGVDDEKTYHRTEK